MSWNIALVQMDCEPATLRQTCSVSRLARSRRRRWRTTRRVSRVRNTGYFVADRIAAWPNLYRVPQAKQLARLARNRGIHLVVGMIERAEDKYYDDAILFTPEGAYHVYRKAHLFGPERAISRRVTPVVVIPPWVGSA